MNQKIFTGLVGTEHFEDVLGKLRFLIVVVVRRAAHWYVREVGITVAVVQVAGGVPLGGRARSRRGEVSALRYVAPATVTWCRIVQAVVGVVQLQLRFAAENKMIDDLLGIPVFEFQTANAVPFVTP